MNLSSRIALLCVLLLPVGATAQDTPCKIRKSDRDGDCVKNKIDPCPDEAGPQALFGCPDRDGDGVPDKDDDCPDQPGLEIYQGCPDTDADGISDLFDECPRVPGLPDRKGCPDADRDGVVDDLDQCPDQPGSAKTFGCPDRDDDGVPDKDDDCPDQPGDASAKGCPDSDGDGIADPADRCPRTPGDPERNGCPEILPADQAILERSRSELSFQAGTALLSPSGQAYLNELAALLHRYPDFHLRLSVHTDSQGATATNQRLTDQQAEACLRYLEHQGIEPGRIRAKGYGETFPISNNRYPEGRAKNRRVEAEMGPDLQ